MARRTRRSCGEFERIVVADDAAVASFVVDARRRMIVGLEREPGDWVALNSTVLGLDQRAFESLRPSEHRAGRWTIIAGGLAPDGASSASITLSGDQRLVPVVDGLYLFAVVFEHEPDPPTAARQLRRVTHPHTDAGSAPSAYEDDFNAVTKSLGDSRSRRSSPVPE
jgi:hypothetical protein